MSNNWTTVIEPKKSAAHYWRELWHYRELFFFLAWRDVKVQYKQTIIGVLWAVLRPFITMVVFTVVFGRIAKMPSEGVPYAILVFSGMLPWQLFASSMGSSSNSLLGNAHMISKVYFPRIIIPASSVIVSMVDFIFSFFIMVAVMIYYRFMPTMAIVYIPIALLLALTTSFGAGLWFSALNVKYRDVRYIIPFLTQFGLYISPVGFSATVVPEKWKMLYYLNPMAGVIDLFRYAITGTTNLYVPGIFMGAGISILVLMTGFLFFRKTERGFADHI